MITGVEKKVPGHPSPCDIDLHCRTLFVLRPRRDRAVTEPFTFPQKLRHLFKSREVENWSGVVQASLVILAM